ncbi:Rv3235 family protein [Actinomadura barringtoniae]|uniref:Rv3235 family protein n=1 Tax=Actinomadura barringtoniae TaxID=1427535 RepID=UPI0024423517|nr:Rv3235 family protein [Actinomadura barringtoniae]
MRERFSYVTDGSLALQAGADAAWQGPGPVEATVRLVVEVMAGTVPVRQLARRATAEVCMSLAAHQAPLANGARVSPPRVLTSWMQEPAAGVAEAGAVVVLNGTVQALALRLEYGRGRWRCTTIETAERMGSRLRKLTLP